LTCFKICGWLCRQERNMVQNLRNKVITSCWNTQSVQLYIIVDVKREHSNVSNIN
jgi:hypothetical protein